MNARVFQIAHMLATSAGLTPGANSFTDAQIGKFLVQARNIHAAERHPRGKSRGVPRSAKPAMRCQAVRTKRHGALGENTATRGDVLSLQVTPLETARDLGNRFTRRAVAKSSYEAHAMPGVTRYPRGCGGFGPRSRRARAKAGA
jgi:hypothetical protein